MKLTTTIILLFLLPAVWGNGQACDVELPCNDGYPGTANDACIDSECIGEECYFGQGAGYRGKVAETEGGFTCQKWSEQEPHQHTNTPDAFPEACLDENYCRNPCPSLGSDRPWCYTTDETKRWDWCKIPECDCYGGGGQDYRGTAAKTITGLTCQPWSAQEPHCHENTPENKPDAGLGTDLVPHNYCRNPDNSHWPWCYTTDPETRWEQCQLPKCGRAGPACTTTEVGNVVFGTPCHFPFTYNNVSYDKCITEGKEVGLWCATTPIYDPVHPKWGGCNKACTKDVLVVCPVEVDVVFVLDSSGSIPQNQFEDIIREFAKTISGGLPISPTESRVGVVRFASSAQLMFGLLSAANNNLASLETAIDGVTYTGGSTATKAGVEVATAELINNGRADKTRMIVVVTDGKFNTGGTPQPAVNAAVAAGIHMVAVGAGSGINMAQLLVLANQQSDYVFQSDTIEETTKLIGAVHDRICGAEEN